jgi:hypothetical protein
MAQPPQRSTWPPCSSSSGIGHSLQNAISYAVSERGQRIVPSGIEPSDIGHGPQTQMMPETKPYPSTTIDECRCDPKPLKPLTGLFVGFRIGFFIGYRVRKPTKRSNNRYGGSSIRKRLRGVLTVAIVVSLYGIMAGAHGNRTHQEPVSRPLTGFEDRAGHQPRTHSPHLFSGYFLETPHLRTYNGISSVIGACERLHRGVNQGKIHHGTQGERLVG